MFQKAVDSLFLMDSVDMYITSSNAYILSSQINKISALLQSCMLYKAN